VIPFPPPVHGRSVTIRLFAPCPAAESGLDATMSADVALGEPDRSNDLDLGDVKLRRLPLLIAGRVVDPQGRGLPHPKVELWAGSSRPQDGPDATIVAGGQGRFVLHGDTSESSLLVTAELDGWYLPGTTVGARGDLALPKLKVPVGSSDVSIELHRCGVARGELLLAPGVEPEAISLETSPRPPAAQVVREEGAGFKLVGIPGLCDLAARGSGRCLLTLIDRIELRDGTPTDEPRILPLDVTGVVRMPVLVVDRGGAPIPGASFVLSSNSEGAAATRVFRADPFGREVIVAVQNDGPLLVGAAGLRMKREPLESLTARYLPDRADSDAVRGMLEGLIARSADRPARDAKLDVLLSAPGSWSFVVTFADPDRRTEEYLMPEPRSVTVVDVGEVQHFDLRISDPALRWVMAQLER
jgi:sarcosine oxidase gamma subunit